MLEFIMNNLGNFGIGLAIIVGIYVVCYIWTCAAPYYCVTHNKLFRLKIGVFFKCDLSCKFNYQGGGNYYSNKTVLDIALINKNIRMIEYLIPKRVGANFDFNDYLTLLGLDSKVKDYTILDMFLADKDSSSLWSLTYNVVATNQYDVLRHMLRKGIKTDGLLSHAVSSDIFNMDTFNAILDYGADIEEVNDGGDTPLIEAVKKDNVEAVSFFIDNGANTKVLSKDELNLLQEAIKSMSLKVAKFLIDKKGFDINIKTGNKKTLLFLVRGQQGHSKPGEMVEFLKEKGVDINAVDNNRFSLLHYSAAGMNGSLHYDYNKDLLNALLKNGADMELKDSVGRTSLFLSVLHDDNKRTQLLIDKGASIYVTDKYGNYLPDLAQFTLASLNASDC